MHKPKARPPAKKTTKKNSHQNEPNAADVQLLALAQLAKAVQLDFVAPQHIVGGVVAPLAFRHCRS
jgi:hypothetical protein